MNTATKFACAALLIGTSACVDGGGPRRAVGEADASPDIATGLDRDNDGVPTPADCNDENPAIFPGAIEDCTTPEDEDCDGLGLDDLDCVVCAAEKDDDGECEDEDDDIDEDMDEDVDEDMDEDVDEDLDEGVDAADAGIPDAGDTDAGTADGPDLG
ncbi:MAG: MopE-related protein [Myxococcota bacterium]